MTRDTLSQVQLWLTNTGYSEDMMADDAVLRAAPSGKRYAPDELVIAAVYRFEGDTDPGDESILFALESPKGTPVGTFVAPYGPATTPADGAIIKALRTKGPSTEDIHAHSEHDHIAAVFPDHDDAEAAVSELRERGFGSDHLGLAIHGGEHVAFEHDDTADVTRDVAVGAAAGLPVGFLGGMALAAIAVPGLGVLGVAGLFAMGVASGVGTAMLGGYLGIAAADRALDEHDQIAHTPLRPGEVLVAVCSHGAPATVEAVLQRHGGRLLPDEP